MLFDRVVAVARSATLDHAQADRNLKHAMADLATKQTWADAHPVLLPGKGGGSGGGGEGGGGDGEAEAAVAAAEEAAAAAVAVDAAAAAAAAAASVAAECAGVLESAGLSGVGRCAYLVFQDLCVLSRGEQVRPHMPLACERAHGVASAHQMLGTGFPRYPQSLDSRLACFYCHTLARALLLVSRRGCG